LPFHPAGQPNVLFPQVAILQLYSSRDFSLKPRTHLVAVVREEDAAFIHRLVTGTSRKIYAHPIAKRQADVLLGKTMRIFTARAP
jgi:hypothetical protein